MARPRQNNPTPAELEVLQVIWERGPSTVRDVKTALDRTRSRAYTSVMSLMNVMTEKGLLSQAQKARAFVYSASVSQPQTQSRLLRDLLNRAFDGSTSALVTQLLEQTRPDQEELDEIQKSIQAFERKEGGA